MYLNNVFILFDVQNIFKLIRLPTRNKIQNNYHNENVFLMCMFR